MLLDNPDKMDTLVKKRTGFMHLRTVQSKATGKRAASHLTPVPEPAKKQRSNERSSGGSASSGDSNTSNAARPLRVALRSARAAAENRPPASKPSAKKRKEDASQSRSPTKPRTRSRKAAAERSPLTSKDANTAKKVESTNSKRGSVMPFGNILGDSSPQKKENTR